MSQPKVWFITGASSGFGLAMTEYLLSKNDIVIATLRNPSVLSALASTHPKSHLLILQLDITSPTQITTAFNTALATFGRIDVVFNNAGHVVLGEVEGTSESSARKVFEVDFWGAEKVSREAVRVFREGNRPSGGLLIQVSGAGGVSAWPGMGYACAAKFALEGLTEALMKEIDPAWNIKIVIFEPGPFKTQVLANLIPEPAHPAYTSPTLPTVLLRAALANPSAAPAAFALDGDVRKAVRMVERLVWLENPPVRLVLHRQALEIAREKIRELGRDVEGYEKWSEDVYVDEV